MDELINQLFTAARGMWKHRWLGLLVAWLVTAIGTVVVLSVPDKYEAGDAAQGAGLTQDVCLRLRLR